MKKIIGFCLLMTMICAIQGVKAQSGLSSGLIAWYPFNNNAKDASGNGHNAIVDNGKLTTDRFGNNNSAYYCSGSKKAMTIPSLGDYKADGVTVSLWVKTGKRGAAVQLVSGAIGVLYLNVHKLGSFVADFDGNMEHLTAADASDSTVTTGNWVNLTATNDGSTTRLYVNGVLQKSYPEKLSTGGSDVIIGNAGYVGYIDDVRIYSRTISATEVTAIYNLPQ